MLVLAANKMLDLRQVNSCSRTPDFSRNIAAGLDQQAFACFDCCVFWVFQGIVVYSSIKENLDVFQNKQTEKKKTPLAFLSVSGAHP